MNLIRQNISVLSTKVVEVSGTTNQTGIEIPLGVPTSGNFYGLVTGWTTSTYVTDAIDDLNKKIITLTSTTLPSNSVLTFNSTTDWYGPNNGYYYVSYPVSIHLIQNPVYSIQELNANTYYEIKPDHIIVSGNGDISIYVIDDPDGRFSGRIIIS